MMKQVMAAYYLIQRRGFFRNQQAKVGYLSSNKPPFKRIVRSDPIVPPHDRFHVYKRRRIYVMVKRFRKFSGKEWFRHQSIVYEKVVERLIATGYHLWIKDCLEYQKQFSDITNEAFAARIIRLYGKAGMFDYAIRTFRQLPRLKCERTVLSFNALLQASVNSKRIRTEHYFYKLPLILSITPNDFSYNIVVKGLCRKRLLDKAISFIEEMSEMGVVFTQRTYNFLLHCLRCRNNKILEIEKVWNHMLAANFSPDVGAYLSRCVALVKNRRVAEAVSLFEEMEKNKVKPIAIILDVLIRGFCRSGDFIEAKRWYAKIEEHHLIPAHPTFCRMIGIGWSNGDYDLVDNLLSMSFRLKRSLGKRFLQGVVNGFIKESRIVEAQNIVKQAEESFKYKLNLPSKFSSHWIPPKSGWIKINTDGSSKHSLEGACGGIARDNLGNWIFGFSRRIDNCSSIEAELCGAIFALEIAHDRGYKKIVLEIDSEEIFSKVGDPYRRAVGLEGPWQRLVSFLDMDWSVEVMKTVRTNNTCADKLAENGRHESLEGQIWDSLPSFLNEEYSADLKNVPIPQRTSWNIPRSRR